MILSKTHYMYENQTDEELVVLARTDREVFGVLIERYTDKLLRYMRRITNKREEDLKDILQETFIKAYINLNNFNTDLSFSSWIYRIAHNHVISVYRKDKARPHGNSIDIEDHILENIIGDEDVFEEVDRHFLRNNLDRCLVELPEKYREVLILNFFEEKDYREISDILKKPIGTIGTLLNRAKKALKHELVQQGLHTTEL